MWPTFFIRVSPASRNAKPACMNMTSTAAKTTQIVDAAIASSLLLSDHLLQHRPVRLCLTLQTGVVQTIPSPDSCPVRAVSTIVVDDRLGDLVRRQRRQQRLREEARLEDAAAVLVRDPRLAPWPTASITVTPTCPVRSVTASITASTLSRTTTASILIMSASFSDHEKSARNSE